MNETPKLRMRWTQFSLCALLLSSNSVAGAQQFNADNQWFAPHGVGTVAATTAEAHSDPQYRFGVRWESPKLIIAATFSEAISHSGSGSDIREPFAKR